MNKCLYCEKIVKNKYCSISCQNRHLNPIRVERRQVAKFGELTVFIVTCSKCTIQFKVEEREKCFPSKKKYFCSRSCANSRVHSVETKKKISSAFRTSPSKTDIYFISCLICNNTIGSKSKTRKTCSDGCRMKLWHLDPNNKEKHLAYSRIGGQKSAEVQSISRSSKNERLFGELCASKFNEVYNNKRMFNGWDADVIIEDIKYAILWNGIWHFKKITKNHSVEQVKNRDNIKIKEITKCGYIPYIINDTGRYDPIFVKTEFDKLCDIVNH
jgi:hypothetical protein